jgi:hypothetical protein
MWKEDHNAAVSDTRHIAVDNLGFVMKLRQSSGNPESFRPKSAAPAVSSKVVEGKDDALMVVEKLKETGCKNSKCLLVDAEAIYAMQEVQICL